MRKVQLCLLTCVSLIVGMFMFVDNPSAETYSVPFRVVKDDTTETSVADQYFQKPATVAIDNDHYVVIMTIRTTHDLGLFPVSVTDFNGQTPAISRTTQGNTDCYQYQFTATDLDSRLNGHMTVNIQSIRYNHYYGYGVVFDTSNLPKIGDKQASSSVTSESHNTTSGSTESSSSVDQSTTTTSSSAVATSKKIPVKVIPHVSVSQQSDQKKSSKPAHKFIWWPWILVIVAIISIVILFERKTHK